MVCQCVKCLLESDTAGKCCKLLILRRMKKMTFGVCQLPYIRTDTATQGSRHPTLGVGVLACCRRKLEVRTYGFDTGCIIYATRCAKVCILSRLIKFFRAGTPPAGGWHASCRGSPHPRPVGMGLAYNKLGTLSLEPFGTLCVSLRLSSEYQDVCPPTSELIDPPNT